MVPEAGLPPAADKLLISPYTKSLGLACLGVARSEVGKEAWLARAKLRAMIAEG